MIKMRSVVSVLLVIAALACGDDGSGNQSGAGSGGGFTAGVGGIPGMAGVGGGAGDSGAAGMLAAGSGGIGGDGTAGMAGGMGVAGMGVAGMGMAGMAGGMGMAGMGGAAGMGPNCIGSGTTAPQPTFTWFFENIVPNCAGPLCHSSVAGGNLTFDTKENAYAQLMMPAMGMNLGASMNMTNCVDTGMTRVVPNDPDASLLYAKLRTDMDPPCGNRMPTGSTLCADVLEAIRMWIASGAANN